MAENSSNQGKCDICGLRFQTNFVLNQHKILIHSNSIRYGCLKCEKSFDEKSSLRKHICDKDFRRNSPLERVLMTVEKVEKVEKYKCSHCEKTFEKMLNCRRHVAKGVLLFH